jgi:Ca-activated chloride channel family protein
MCGSGRKLRYPVRLGLLAVLAAAVISAGGCGPVADDPPPTDEGPAEGGESPATGAPADHDAGQIKLLFPYGSEKKQWLRAVTEEFNLGGHQLQSGKQIFVEAEPMGSGELKDAVLEGRVQAHLISPASAAFITLGNAESEAQAGKPLVGPTRKLVLSPVVIAMWKPMAEALGWGEKPVGWSDIIEMAQNEQGWAAHGFPQWGRFKFGHTHPEFSNSGIISLFAEVYAGAQKVRGLTLEDVGRSEVGQYLGNIERSVVHYGRSTGFFGSKMFSNGPQYLSAAVLYENMVIESYDSSKYTLPFPVVAIYPKEGTFWSDHPVGIVQRDWVAEEHREAAQVYIDYLLDRPQQERALEFGFRPADASIPVQAPVDAAHGVDPDQPKTTLEVPTAPVMEAIIELWRRNKKHANVVLVLDTSGSMQGEKMNNAKQGALQLIDLLGDEDRLSLLPFHHDLQWVGKDMAMSSDREKARRAVSSLFANGGTALYNAISAGNQHLVDRPAPDRISAIVVLSDGSDSGGGLTLAQLLDEIRSDGESRTTRVFTIGYETELQQGKILKEIAESTKAKFFEGTAADIHEVFRDISTFF